MINLNDRSALENYYLLKKVPEYSHVINPAKSVLKNARYFSMRPSENIWNNESRCSEKQYQFYHQINEGYSDRIASLNGKEMQKEVEREQLNKLITNVSRIQAQDRIQSRKLERTCLEYESKQPVSCATLIDFLGIKSQTGEMRKHKALKLLGNRSYYLQGRAQSSWNDMSQTSEKFLLQATNERILEKDSQAFEDIVKRIEKDNDDEILRSRIVAANIANIRQSFRKRSVSNCETEKHVLANRPSLHSEPRVVFVSGQGKDKGKSEEEEAAEKLAQQIKEFEESDKTEKMKLNEKIENERNIYNDEIFNQSPYAQAQQSPVSFDMLNYHQQRSASNPKKNIQEQREISYNSKQSNSNELSHRNQLKQHANQVNVSDQNIKISQILSQVLEPSPNPSIQENKSFLSRERQFIKSKKNPSVCAPLDELEMQHQHKGHFSHHQVESPVSLPLRFLKTPIKHRVNSRIDELSQPKLKSDFQTPTAQLSEREEFRGLLCSQVNKVDLNQSNPFIKTVLSNSKVARDLQSSNGLSRHTRNIFSNSCYSSKNQSFFKQSSEFKQQNFASNHENKSTNNDNSSYSAIKQSQEVIHENSYFLTPIEEPCEDKDMQELSQFKINDKERKRGFPGNTLREFRNALKEIDSIKKKDAFATAYANPSQLIKQ